MLYGYLLTCEILGFHCDLHQYLVPRGYYAASSGYDFSGRLFGPRNPDDGPEKIPETSVNFNTLTLRNTHKS